MSSLSVSKNGKLETTSKVKLSAKNISQIYTPGVADVVTEIANNQENVYKYTWKGRTIAIVSDGSAILGLGNQGPKAALPVMEAKAVLFKMLGGIDAVPIVIDTQDEDEIVRLVKNIAPGFGGINLEDISAPRCFSIEERLKKELDIPVFHDDQYGTAIVVLAGLINASKVAKRSLRKSSVVVSGAGAAGIATTRLLLRFGVKNISLFDSKGSIYEGRKNGMNETKTEIAKITNKKKFTGGLGEALVGTDIFIGVSVPNLIDRHDIEKMAKKSIVFALANPIPEIMPKEAKKGGAFVIATGRSDFDNQINNALVFPGIFKGALSTRTTSITDELKIKAAKALAGIIKDPTRKKVVPKVMNKMATQVISKVF